MTILRIEHAVSDYGTWKAAFDSDPVGREQTGVRRYRIMRPVDDPHYVMIDLEFDCTAGAEALLAGMRQVWRNVDGTLIADPRAQIVEPVETAELQ
jgi:hypothetical protein